MISRSHQGHGIQRLRHRLEQMVQRKPQPVPGVGVSCPPQSQHSVSAIGFLWRRMLTASNDSVLRAGFTAARTNPDVLAILVLLSVALRAMRWSELRVGRRGGVATMATTRDAGNLSP